ncbi:MAG: hypothetical protein KH441_12380 [Clostridium sp.]|nr:hypothetical protein [Clostridium sp.]
MRKYKKLLAGVLSLAMMATTSFVSLADVGLGGNTNSDGDTTVGSNAAYAHRFMAYPENQGYRISIVDKTGDRVTNSIDIVNYVPTDINNIGYENSNNGGGRQEFISGYNKYINYIGWSAPKAGINKKNTFYYSNGIKTEAYSDLTWNKNGVPTGYNLKGEPVETNMYPKNAFEALLSSKYDSKVAELTANGVEGLAPLPKDANGRTIPIKISLPSILNSSKTGFEPGGMELMKYFEAEVGKFGQELNQRSLSGAYNVLSLLVDTVGPVYNNKGEWADRFDYLFRFTNPAEQARVGKEEPDKITGELSVTKPSDIITEKGYKVIVEPLYWFVPEILTVDPVLLARNGGSSNYGNVTGVCYGTVSYLAKYTHDLMQKDLPITDDMMHRCWVGPNWGTGELGVTTLMLAYDDADLKIYEPSGGPEPLAKVGGREEWSLHSLAHGDNFKNSGYAVHIYDNLLIPDGTSTFDEINYSSSSTDGFRPGPSEDKSNEGGLESKNRIVKYYANKLSNEYIYTENHTRENTVSQVTLENEEGYKVDSWFTSNEFRKPSSHTDSYDDCKSSIPNKQTGTSTGSVQLEKEDTLYLRLVKQPEVTKIYESDGATDKVVVDNNPRFEGGSLIVTTPDEGYDYVEGVESPENADPDSWQDVPAGNSTTDTRIPVKDTTKEIFIHYKKPDTDANMILHENEISHQFGLSDANNGVLVQGVVNYSSVSSGESCDEDVGDDDDYEACGSDYEWVDSEAWHFSLSNHKVYDKKFVWDWRQTGATSWGADDLGESGGDRKTGSNEPDGRMVLQRSFSDRPVLYPNMNQNTESTLINMGLNAPAYIPKADRYGNKPEQPSRVSWTGTFETDWVFDSNSPQATFEPSCGHGGSDTDTHNTSNNKSELDGAYSKPNNTTIYGLWGKENKGDKALADTAQQNIWKLGTLNFKGFKNHVKEQAFTFYPYYKMKFISQLDGAEQDAYLTAENLSTLFSLQRIDTSIFRPKGATTLELTSSQWSTHAKAHNLLDAAGVENKNSLLPAGAIYDLRTAGNGVKASQSWIGYRVFNSYVMDKNALADATNVKTKQEVVDAVNAFKNDTKNVLSNYEVVMVGQEGINPDDNNGEFYRGSEVITGKDGSYRLGQEFIRDSKYDLQTTGSASGNSSDIDVLEELEETYDWVLTSDADGNVVITRNGTELERLQKNQKNLTNAEVKEFDSRTNIVTNFLSAIDRNMGSDRNGKTWYNEGFSIGCLETRLAYRMGFGDGDASLRSTALNIKANGKLENRNDMFNGDEAKNRSYQFFTSARSTLNGCEKDYVGTYDGIKIFIPNMNQLLVSNRFYTSNTTVMDLN